MEGQVLTMRTATGKRAADMYFDRVRAFPLRRIRNAGEHARAKNIYLRLANAVQDRGTRDYLDVLADLIADYEKRANQTVATSNITIADLVRHRMQERAMSVSALANEIGIAQSNLSEMLNGRRDWSKAAIRALSNLFSIRAERFLG
jgi:antitoxin component HigA of HigAB toxin-antitoxin module